MSRRLEACAPSAIVLPAQILDSNTIDEIGKMECLSTRFVAAMRELLDSGLPGPPQSRIVPVDS